VIAAFEGAWSSEGFYSVEHFDLLIAIPRRERGVGPTSAPAAGRRDDPNGSTAAPVHLVRVEVFIQYRVDEGRLGDYTRNAREPDALLRVLAWNEVSKFVASATIDELLGELMVKGGPALRERLNRRIADLGLGISVVEVGFPKVHPEKSVSTAFRKVVTAQMEKTAEIRRAIVTENQMLSEAAGDRRRARQLARAIRNVTAFEQSLSLTELQMRSDAPLSAAEEAAMTSAEPAFEAAIAVEWELQRRIQERDDTEKDWGLGLGRTTEQRNAAQEAVKQAEQQAGQARQALESALVPARAALAARGAEQVERQIAHRRARVGAAFWDREVEHALIGVEGAAQVILAQARAERWERELRAAAEVARVLNERSAFEAAPEVYLARRYLEVLREGIREARKYVLAFDPSTLHLRLEAQEQARPELTDMPTRMSTNP